jgi:hypothetical protein
MWLPPEAYVVFTHGTDIDLKFGITGVIDRAYDQGSLPHSRFPD